MLAHKTLLAIEEALEADQGAKFRGFLAETMPTAGDAYSTTKEGFRSHLGASLIGRKCDRELWYSFRWSLRGKLTGRMIRLFNRGHLEEPRFIALLRMINVHVWQYDAQGNQYRIFGHLGHFGGSMDGVAENIPDVPYEPVLTEFKTHNEKSFQKLRDVGVLAAKWEHFVQTQMYMGHNSLNWALYLAANKNDDDLHGEVIKFDPGIYNKYQQRSIKIIDATEAPKKINQSSAWYECKFCNYRQLCHGDAPPETNCRTCKYSTPVNGGQWYCNKHATTLSKNDQLAACPSWDMIRSMKESSL